MSVTARVDMLVLALGDLSAAANTQILHAAAGDNSAGIAQLLEEVAAELDGQAAELTAGRDLFTAELEGFDSLFQTVFDSLQESTAALETRVGSFLQEELTLYSDGLLQTVDTARQEISDSLGETYRDELELMRGEHVAMCSRFSTEVQQQTLQLQADLAGELNGVMDRMLAAFEEQITSTARLAMEDALKQMLAEVEANLLFTELGVQVTTALSPWLPQLLTLRAAVNALKHALDALH